MNIPPLLFILGLLLHAPLGAAKKVTRTTRHEGRVLDESVGDDFQFNVATHNEHFKRIKEDVKAIGDSYIQCINGISDNDYSEEAVEGCVGKDLIYMNNDISYERKKLIGRADKKIRDFLMRYCYEVAGTNEEQSNGCDVLERDMLDLLWQELNIYTTIDYHQSKYLFIYGEVPEASFANIMLYSKDLYKELTELINEISQHALIVNASVKTAVNRRTQHVLQRAKDSITNPLPKIYKHKIEIQEQINEPSAVHVDNLPRPIRMDSSTSLYSSHNNPYVEEFNQQTGFKFTRLSNSNGMNTINYGPVVTIPDRKLVNIDSYSSKDEKTEKLVK